MAKDFTLTIKDSGERTEFETGAVRDMHTGKGRMDLLPWEALVEVSKHCEEGALKYGERNCEKGIPMLKMPILLCWMKVVPHRKPVLFCPTA